MAKPKSTTICPLGGAGLGGQQKTLIWFHLLSGPHRFGALQRLMPHASRQMLTIQLREMEQIGVVARQVYDEQPPRVEYSLTDLGRKSEAMIRRFVAWGEWFCAQMGLDYKEWLAGLGSRWRLWVWYSLLTGPKRFSEVRQTLPQISRQKLTVELRELERMGVVIRRTTTGNALKVDYALTDLGQQSRLILRQIYAWALDFNADVGALFDCPLAEEVMRQLTVSWRLQSNAS